MTLRRRDRGAITLEAVILTPILAGLLSTAIAFGRVAAATSNVDAAAYAAARAASLQRSAAAARTSAQAAAAESLDQSGLRCTAMAVDTDATQYARPAGTPAAVTVQISCTVSLADLVVPGMPGSKTITGQAVSSIDSFRGRS